MISITSSLTLFFEDPFWVGIFERNIAGELEVCRIVFGAEPKDNEVYEFFLNNESALKFSPPVDCRGPENAQPNSKRMRRAVRRSLQQTGIGTKAQQALKLQQQVQKLERRACSHRRAEEEKELLFEKREHKRKEKHRGR